MKAYTIGLALTILALTGCQKAFTVFHGRVPSSVKVKKLDMTGASALAVMPYSGAPKVKTKAGEEAEDRLFIIDKDGKTTLASFSIDESGAANNKIWKEIRKTLTLVPSEIIRIKDDLLLLSNVRTVYDYVDWRNDAMGFPETDAINRLLSSLEGPFFLRITDGALFKSPFDCYGDRPAETLSSVLKCTSDGKRMALMGSQYKSSWMRWKLDLTSGSEVIEEYVDDPLHENVCVITDNGNTFEAKYPSERLFAPGSMVSFMLDKDRIVVFTSDGGDGTWSFDLDLNPLFLDYGSALKEIMKTHKEWYFFEWGSDTYVLSDDPQKNSVSVHRISFDGKALDCSSVYAEETEESRKIYDNKGTIVLTDRGVSILARGSRAEINLSNGSLTVENIPSSFPQEWESYDEKGIAYTLTENEIVKYDINTSRETTLPIHWEQVDFGGFVTFSYQYANGVFSVSGRTRTAQSVTVLIDAETGNVSMTEFAEYSGSFIKTYYRLNN